MKNIRMERTVVGNFPGRVVESSLSMNNLGLVMDMLAKGYADRPGAAVREYVSNAWDSHVLANQSRAVEVTLPTALNPLLVVQDWGVGMSLEHILSHFINFIESSKTKDNRGIGGKGIGAKAGLAVGEQFTVRAVKDGLLNVFVMRRNGMAIQSSFAIENRPTEEPNGVRVEVPVTSPQSFEHSRMREVLSGWSTKDVKVLNLDSDVRLTDEWVSLEHGFVSPEFFGDECGVGRMFSYGMVRVGPVAYPYNLSGGHSYSMRDFCVSLPIGTVEFAANREAVDPSVASNQRTVNKYLGLLQEDAKAHFESLVAGVSTLTDAVRLANSVAAREFNVNVMFEGNEVPQNIVLGQGKAMMLSMTRNDETRSGKTVSRNSGLMHLGTARTKYHLLHNDLGYSTDRTVRLLHEAYRLKVDDLPSDNPLHFMLVEKDTNPVILGLGQTQEFIISTIQGATVTLRQKERDAAKAAGTPVVRDNSLAKRKVTWQGLDHFLTGMTLEAVAAEMGDNPDRTYLLTVEDSNTYERHRKNAAAITALTGEQNKFCYILIPSHIRLTDRYAEFLGLSLLTDADVDTLGKSAPTIATVKDAPLVRALLTIDPGNLDALFTRVNRTGTLDATAWKFLKRVGGARDEVQRVRDLMDNEVTRNAALRGMGEETTMPEVDDYFHMLRFISRWYYDGESNTQRYIQREWNRFVEDNPGLGLEATPVATCTKED